MESPPLECGEAGGAVGRSGASAMPFTTNGGRWSAFQDADENSMMPGGADRPTSRAGGADGVRRSAPTVADQRGSCATGGDAALYPPPSGAWSATASGCSWVLCATWAAADRLLGSLDRLVGRFSPADDRQASCQHARSSRLNRPQPEARRGDERLRRKREMIITPLRDQSPP